MGADGDNTDYVTGTAITFVGVEDLTGSAGDDTFAFGVGGVSGQVNGGLGKNTLDYSALSTPVEVLLSVGAASHTSGIGSI